LSVYDAVEVSMRDELDYLGSDERAEAYAAWARGGADWTFSPVLDELVSLLPPPPLPLLDVGCGEGRLGADLIRRGYDVMGVDFAPRMIELASEHHPAIVADASTLPFSDETFQCVVTVHVLMEIENLSAAVTEIARVLQRSGVLIAAVEHPFLSGRHVAHYSEESHHGWNVTHEGSNIGVGGIHRPLQTYLDALQHASLELISLREISVGRFDPMTLFLRARKA
jgi:SAM-dependent methyltransferase